MYECMYSWECTGQTKQIHNVAVCHPIEERVASVVAAKILSEIEKNTNSEKVYVKM